MPRKKLQGKAASGLQLQFHGNQSQIAILRLNRSAKRNALNTMLA